jgi:dihydrofolate synthase/folylpolyglutamate synthase
LPDLFLPLLGRFQLVNAATALAALMELHAQGFHIAEDAIRQGLARVQWHGRFEVLSQNPFLVADSAMNAASARALVSALDAFFPHTRVHLIFGASSDKDIRGMLQELVPRASSLILTRSRNPRAADPQVLADLAAPALSLIAVDMPTALDLARQRAESNDAILATGSSFVAAEIRALVLAERGVPVESD